MKNYLAIHESIGGNPAKYKKTTNFSALLKLGAKVANVFVALIQ